MRGLVIGVIVLVYSAVLLAGCSRGTEEPKRDLAKYSKQCLEQRLKPGNVLEGYGGQIINLERASRDAFYVGYVPLTSQHMAKDCKVFMFGATFFWNGEKLFPADDEKKRMMSKDPSLEKKWDYIGLENGFLVGSEADLRCLKKPHICKDGDKVPVRPSEDRIVKLKNYPLEVWLPPGEEGLNATQGSIRLYIRDWPKHSGFARPLAITCSRLDSFDITTREGIANINYGDQRAGCEIGRNVDWLPFNEGIVQVSLSRALLKDPITPLLAIQAHLNSIFTGKTP